MDDKNYDEFGNYIGPDIPEINDDDEDEEINDNNSQDNNQPSSFNEISNNNITSNSLFNNIPNESYQVVLHEDKNFYPEAEEIYPGVSTLFNALYYISQHHRLCPHYGRMSYFMILIHLLQPFSVSLIVFTYEIL